MGEDADLSDAAVIAQLRAVATALRLGGLDALRRSAITTTPAGSVLTLRALDTREPIHDL